MFWEAVIVACLAVGAFAELEVPEDKKEFLKNILQQQCTNNGAPDKVDEVEAAGKAFVDCMKGLFDANTIKTEIEEAKPRGALDEVFGKYCAKTPQLKTCLHTLFDAVSPCLESGARNQIDTLKDGSNQLIDFVCYKDGDRIALFIAEGGPECFKEKANSIRECAEQLKNNVESIEAAKKLSTADKCLKYDNLSRCIVTSLEECSTPTPGNMAESLFKYVRKSSPCHTALPRRD